MTTAFQMKGEYHKINGSDNQDVIYEAESRTAKIIAIADGVSTCKNSRLGAEIACKAVSDIMLGETEYMFSSADEKVAGLLSAYVFKKLRVAAEEMKQDVRTYSSTLSFVCFNKISGKIMTFLLGDSLIYLISDGSMTLACSPEMRGDSKTYTTTTEGVAEVIDISVFLPEKNSTYLLATDGAWKSLYSGGELSEEAEKAIKEENIIGYLQKQHCMDDCSVVMLEIPKGA